jgi:hypothetical protein
VDKILSFRFCPGSGYREDEASPSLVISTLYDCIDGILTVTPYCSEHNHRIHEALLNSALIDGLTAANTKDEIENIIARAVEGTKQLHVLNACVTEKASGEKYLKKRGKKE